MADPVNPSPSLDFTVPEPNRHTVADEAMINAERNLAASLEANNGKNVPVKGVSPQDAETMLKWAVENARAGMIANSPHKEAILTTPAAQDGNIPNNSTQAGNCPTTSSGMVFVEIMRQK